MLAAAFVYSGARILPVRAESQEGWKSRRLRQGAIREV